MTHILVATAESALDEIDTALQRLKDGSYGICERCVEPIPWERLETLPMSRLCTTCQHVAESGGPTTCVAARPGLAGGSGDRDLDHDHKLHHRRTGRLAASPAAHRWRWSTRALLGKTCVQSMSWTGRSGSTPRQSSPERAYTFRKRR